jgi:hypothetical protein
VPAKELPRTIYITWWPDQAETRPNLSEALIRAREIADTTGSVVYMSESTSGPLLATVKRTSAGRVVEWNPLG